MTDFAAALQQYQQAPPVDGYLRIHTGASDSPPNTLRINGRLLTLILNAERSAGHWEAVYAVETVAPKRHGDQNRLFSPR